VVLVPASLQPARRQNGVDAMPQRVDAFVVLEAAIPRIL